MKYFRAEEDPTAKLPKNFMSGFLEVGWGIFSCTGGFLADLCRFRGGIDWHFTMQVYIGENQCLQSALSTPCNASFRANTLRHRSPSSAIKSSIASVKVALVDSQKLIKSLQPFRSASNADTPLSSVRLVSLLVVGG
jgi:hypothetical protein